MTIKGLITRIKYYFKYRHTALNPIDIHKNGVAITENIKLIHCHLDWNHDF